MLLRPITLNIPRTPQLGKEPDHMHSQIRFGKINYLNDLS